MSLMLEALRRIESRQPARTAPRPAEIAQPITAAPTEPMPQEPPAAPIAAEEFQLLDDWTPEPQGDPQLQHLPPLDSVALETLPTEAEAIFSTPSFDVAFDQIEAFVAEASLLYATDPPLDDAEISAALAEAEKHPAPVTEDSLECDAGTMRAWSPPLSNTAEGDSKGHDTTANHASVLKSDGEPPHSKARPTPADPYAETTARILSQLPAVGPRVLMFTSAGDGQGKTTTLARLAPLLAREAAGEVLVVDANDRNPDMARWLNVAPTQRLPDVLDGAAAWSEAVQPTAHARLSLLPGGVCDPQREAAREPLAFNQLLRELSRHYALVLVDAPSLTHEAAAEISSACDASYLVVRLGESSPRMVREAAGVIRDHGGRLLGCVAIDSGA